MSGLSVNKLVCVPITTYGMYINNFKKMSNIQYWFNYGFIIWTGRQQPQRVKIFIKKFRVREK